MVLDLWFFQKKYIPLRKILNNKHKTYESMKYKYYHILEPKDYFMHMSAEYSLDDVKKLLRCSKVVEISEDEYRKVVSPFFYELEQRGKALKKSIDGLIGDVIEELKNATPEEIERFRAQIAQCGFSAEEMKQAMKNFAELTKYDH